MGILNWMLQGFQRLLANGCFTESKTQEQVEIAFERASDTMGAFLSEMVIFDKNTVTPRSVAFESYKNYCDVFSLESENDKKFTQRLKEAKIRNNNHSRTSTSCWLVTDELPVSNIGGK